MVVESATSIVILIFFLLAISYGLLYSLYYIVILKTNYLLCFLLFLFITKILIYIICPTKFYYDYGHLLFNIGKYDFAKKYLENLNDTESIYKTAYILFKKYNNLEESYYFLIDKIDKYNINEKEINIIAYELNVLNNNNNNNNNNIIQYENKMCDLSKKIIEYILQSKNIILSDSNAIYEYAKLLDDSKIAKLYYLYAIELNNSDAMTSYAYILNSEYNENFELVEYYLMKAIELNNSRAMLVYAKIIYYTDKQKSIDYYLKSIKLNNEEALKYFLKLNITNYDKYLKLKNINSDIAKNGLEILKKDVSVITNIIKLDMN